MAQIQCASCGAMVSEDAAFFGEQGQVCGSCHSRDDLDSAARFRESGEQGIRMMDGTLRHSRTEVDDQGRQVTHKVRVELGPLGVILKLVMSLVGWLTGRRAQG